MTPQDFRSLIEGHFEVRELCDGGEGDETWLSSYLHFDATRGASLSTRLYIAEAKFDQTVLTERCHDVLDADLEYLVLGHNTLPITS